MSIHRCDFLCVLEAEVESSQIQRHLSTVHLDCNVRCSSQRSTTYPQRLHFNYVQSLKDVVSSRVVLWWSRIQFGIGWRLCRWASVLSCRFPIFGLWYSSSSWWLVGISTPRIPCVCSTSFCCRGSIRGISCIRRNWAVQQCAFPRLMFVLLEHHSDVHVCLWSCLKPHRSNRFLSSWQWLVICFEMVSMLFPVSHMALSSD